MSEQSPNPEEQASPSTSDQDTSQPEPARRWVRTPPIDIFEMDHGLVLRADLPGVKPDALDLQVQDNRLTLFGRVDAGIPDNATLLHKEYQPGDFLRSFILSDDVDHDRISAKLVNGVLEVTLPKAAKSQPRKISIQSD